MFAQIIVIFTILVVVTGDVVNDIRVDEEKRHNTTLTKYVKAAFGGALRNIFPGVNNQEIEEADRLLAYVFPIGDPSIPLPDTDEKMRLNLCANHRERGAKLLAYVRKRWPTHLIAQVTVRIGIHSFGEKNDDYCRDTASRSVYTKNASVINQYLNELNVARNKFIDNNMVIVYGNTTLHKLAILCCSIWNLKAQFVNSIPVQQTKMFVKDYMESHNGKALKYLCIYHSEGSKACANLVIPPPPTNVPRFTSVCSASMASISKLTAISA